MNNCNSNCLSNLSSPKYWNYCTSSNLLHHSADILGIRFFQYLCSLGFKPTTSPLHVSCWTRMLQKVLQRQWYQVKSWSCLPLQVHFICFGLSGCCPLVCVHRVVMIEISRVCVGVQGGGRGAETTMKIWFSELLPHVAWKGQIQPCMVCENYPHANLYPHTHYCLNSNQQSQAGIPSAKHRLS